MKRVGWILLAVSLVGIPLLLARKYAHTAARPLRDEATRYDIDDFFGADTL